MKIKKHTVIGSVALSCLLAISVIKHKTSTPIKTPLVVESEKNEFFNKQQVIEDIDFAINKVKQHHMSCLKEVPQEVLQQKDIEIANLQDQTSTIKVWKILSRILAKLHDAHSVAYRPAFLFRKQLPFQINHVDDKIFCDSGEFKDAEIIEVDGIKISDLY